MSQFLYNESPLHNNFIIRCTDVGVPKLGYWYLVKIWLLALKNEIVIRGPEGFETSNYKIYKFDSTCGSINGTNER